jgi:hypothetical protein
MSCHPCILQTLLGQVDKGMPSLRIFILCNVHVAISHGICPRVKEGALYCVFGKDKEARKAVAAYLILSTVDEHSIF